MSIGESHAIPPGEVVRQRSARGWQAYVTAQEIVVVQTNGLGGRHVALRARRGDVRRISTEREIPWLLLLIGLVTVLPFYASFLVQSNETLPGIEFWLYTLSPLSFFAGLAYISVLFFTPRAVRITLQDGRAVRMPDEFRGLFDDLVA